MKRATFVAVIVSACAAAVCILAVQAAPGPEAASSSTKISTLMVTPERVQAQRAQMKKAKIDVGPTPTLQETLNEDGLHTMLANLGLQPTTYSNSDGSKYEYISEENGGTTFHLSLTLSADMTNIWIDSYLGQVKDPDNAAPSYWYTLQSKAMALWPVFVSYSPSDKELIAHQSLPNSNVTQAQLRSTLDSYMSSLVATESVWYAPGWTYSTPAAAPSAPAAPAAPSSN